MMMNIVALVLGPFALFVESDVNPKRQRGLQISAPR